MCHGVGCDECEAGKVLITGCPYEAIEPSTVEVLRVAEFWKKGIPPVAGGYLDQTDWIIEACELAWADQAKWRRRNLALEFDGD